MKQKYLMKVMRFCAVIMLVTGVVAAGFVSPVVYAVDTTTVEGDQMKFTVTLGIAPNGWAVRYKYKTEDGSAIQGQDYDNTTGAVTFNSGVKEQTVYVNTIAAAGEENAEVFKLKLYDQEVNGLYAVDGWVTPTDQIRGMPRTITLTGQIIDQNSAAAAGAVDTN